ncbi:hypothetical protein Scep_009048 [Stephania cephalantha]|uniref:Alanyl-transfer RNA synthetases family profile domain-containing protein n=1 Tax=Stephania cephalantha TaxID=152367 RepID=A0AAP0JUT6_9MAGN
MAEEPPMKTNLAYFDDMWNLTSKAKLLSHSQGGDGRRALILDSTIFYPQGGGQPSDSGFISRSESDRIKFVVEDVRLKDGVVFHYGHYEENSSEEELEGGQEVCLFVDEQRRRLNSRLHTAGHLLDSCMRNVGLGHLEPGKGYHFPDGPYVEYKGTIPQNDWLSKQKELELNANELISNGGKVMMKSQHLLDFAPFKMVSLAFQDGTESNLQVYAAIASYEEALDLCGGGLPEYIPVGSAPRVVKLGDNPGCPCGGTHVADIAEIRSIKVSQIRTKKGFTKVFYTLGDSLV